MSFKKFRGGNQRKGQGIDTGRERIRGKGCATEGHARDYHGEGTGSCES
jgi:hypothetical protein